MPKRKHPPRLKLMVEFEMNRPEPSEITAEMAEEMHHALFRHADKVVPRELGYADGTGAKLVRITRVVK